MASDAGALIAAAAIGAGGAVAAQVISSVVMGRRDAKRFQWEQATKDRELDAQKAERFLNQKQELYSSYGSLIAECLQYAARHIEPSEGPEPPELPDITALQRVRANIELIAPDEVSRLVVVAYMAVVGTVWSSTSEHLSFERRRAEADAGQRAWHQAFDAMRVDLQGEKRRYFQPVTEHKELPKDPPPVWMLPWWRRTLNKLNRL